MRKFAFSYSLLLLAFWTGLVLAGDYVVLETSVRQAIACGFATTTCQIVQSALEQGPVSQRGVDIAYSYTVNGVDHTGHCYRYDSHNGAFDYGAIVNTCPPGARKTVYYNPANPADSVLDPGLSGFDLLLVLFAIPLNVVTVAVWAAVIRARRDPSRMAPAGGVRIVRRPGETRARLAGLSPLTAGFFALAAVAFAAAFPVVSMAGFAPDLLPMAVILGFAAAVGLAACLWTAQRNRSGHYDLRINESAQTLTLPETRSRKEPLIVPRREVVAVSMRRRVSKGPSGNYFSFVPAVDRAAPDSRPQPIELVSWGWTEGKAQAFSQWLSEQLGVQFKGIEEESDPASTH